MRPDRKLDYNFEVCLDVLPPGFNIVQSFHTYIDYPNKHYYYEWRTY